MQYRTVLLDVCLLCLSISVSMVRAGEWVVETHSLIVRAPAAIAGVEDAAIGDVSNLCLLLRASVKQYQQSPSLCGQNLLDLIAVWSAALWCLHAG